MATIIQPTFNPGAVGGNNNYNFVSTFELMKRDVDGKLWNIYGDQLMALMDVIGSTQGLDVGSFFHEHYEENPLMPKIKASNTASTGSGASTTATFTLGDYTSSSDETLSVPNVNPFQGTSGVTYIPVRVNDMLQIGDAIWIVTAIDASAGTFTASPNDSSDSLSSSGQREIIIFSNSFGDGTNQNTPLTNPYNKVTSWLHNVKNTVSWNDTMANMQMYTGDGKEYVIRGEQNCLKQQMNFIDGALLLSEPLANTGLGGGATPRVQTRGLIPQAQDGYVQTYGTGNYDLDDITDLSLNLDLRKGGDAYMILEGAELSASMDRGLIAQLNAGAVSYGAFSGVQKKFIDFNFQGFKFGLLSFHRKRLAWMNDFQGGGADGYTYRQDGIVIPMDMTKDAKTSMPAKRITKLYIKGMEMEIIDRDLRKIGDNGTAKLEVTYNSWCGLKAVGTQQFGYIKRT